MVDFIPGMALIHLTKGTESLGSGSHARHATDGRAAGRGNGRPTGRVNGRVAGHGGGRSGPRSDGADADGSARSPRSDAGPSGEEQSAPITCGFCGQPFVEDRGQATCQACPLSKGCGLMRCPHCGYENAKEPGWLSRIREWIR